MDIVPHPRDLNLLFIAYDGEWFWLGEWVRRSRSPSKAALYCGI